MCGIAGLIGIRDNRLGDSMISAISHRGPDGKHIWCSTSDDFPVTMAHARLSIIDLSQRGDQPFLTEDGRYVFIYNGEIYNFVELR